MNIDALLEELQHLYPNVFFKIENGTIMAVIDRCGCFSVLLKENNKLTINWKAARSTKRMTIFYQREYDMIRDGHAGKYAAVNDDGQITIYRWSTPAFRNNDLDFAYVCQIGIGSCVLNEVVISIVEVSTCYEEVLKLCYMSFTKH